jgi:apolipoprotein N-acyltransferase
MARTITADLPPRTKRISRITSLARHEIPTLIEWSGSFATSLVLVLSFPNFELWYLAWIALVPVLFVVARRPSPFRALILGLTFGTCFFYASCYWLTYSMIHYGGLPKWLAYLLLLPAAMLVGVFPGLFLAVLAQLVKRFGLYAVLAAPFIWATSEWLRLGVTGQLWNALGYSQAYHPFLIQTARWGGVYMVSFLVVAVNAAIALMLLLRTWKAVVIGWSTLLAVALLVAIPSLRNGRDRSTPGTSGGYLNVVGVQPNVPMTPTKTAAETEELLQRHIWISVNGLRAFKDDRPRLVIWPESPMNFTYGSDSELQNVIAQFVTDNHTSLLLNSLEQAPNNGGYNSAVLINEEGRAISQYDKIRLMPFGEYVPLPQRLGGSLISGIVGDFTAGSKYTLMPIAGHRAGVFICIESAYPSIARNLTKGGADFLINISNDGYLGPTAVMRQHLSNAVFRAVENEATAVACNKQWNHRTDIS